MQDAALRYQQDQEHEQDNAPPPPDLAGAWRGVNLDQALADVQPPEDMGLPGNAWGAAKALRTAQDQLGEAVTQAARQIAAVKKGGDHTVQGQRKVAQDILASFVSKTELFSPLAPSLAAAREELAQQRFKLKMEALEAAKAEGAPVALELRQFYLGLPADERKSRLHQAISGGDVEALYALATAPRALQLLDTDDQALAVQAVIDRFGSVKRKTAVRYLERMVALAEVHKDMANTWLREQGYGR